MTQAQPSIAEYYHEQTKYDPESLQQKSQYLDWNKQPVPFKEYKIGSDFELKYYLNKKLEDFSNNSSQQWWWRLSELLFCSYGLTAKIPSMGSTVYLRSAPSAGGLYPAELYIVSRGLPLLPAGLYNYQCRTHSLKQFWDSDVWEKLQAACFCHSALQNSQLAIITTAIFYRSAWRYQDRAYRRIFLDTGHLLGNIELAAAMTNYRPYLIGGFMDEAVNNLLYVDSHQEAATVVIGLLDLLKETKQFPSEKTALPSLTTRDYPPIPDGEILNYLHLHTQIKSDFQAENPEGKTTISNYQNKDNNLDDKYNFSFCDKFSTHSPSINWGKNLGDLAETMYKRRSTRSYSGEKLEFDELKLLLDFTYQPQNYLYQNLDNHPDYFDLNLIETFIAVSGVHGLEPGCYYYAPKAQELRQIRFKNFRSELHFLCLGQELGRDAAAVIFHTADLKKAVDKYGDRVYRYLHLDAGHLGQRLNLAAIRLNLGVSGIGGFFDNQVNDILGIPIDEAVVYITTLGRLR